MKRQRNDQPNDVLYPFTSVLPNPHLQPTAFGVGMHASRADLRPVFEGSLAGSAAAELAAAVAAFIAARCLRPDWQPCAYASLSLSISDQ